MKLDKKAIKEFFSEDSEIIRVTIDSFLNGHEQNLAAMEQALQQENFEDLERNAHTPKGNIGYFLLTDLRELAFELEQRGRQQDIEGARELFPKFKRDCGVLAQELEKFKLEL